MPTDHKANILLVDDQPSNLLALEAILEDLDQNLVRATSGEEALRRLLDDDFAVILMDVKMPGLDGIETAALIRERDRCQHTPIIFLTAFERSDVQMFKGYQLGAVDYLFKPPEPEVLRSKVSVFVELHKKTEQVKRQAAELRDSQRRELERKLAEEKQRWELERLRQEAERERKAAEALKDADRRKDEFLAMLAHELRNPLAPILNALHVIRVAEDPAALGAARDIVERQVKHMARLIDDLLDISRINSGRIKLQKERVELAAVVKGAIESVAPLIESRRHELVVALPPWPVRLFADPTRLEQVLANLLNNAAKYTPEGGRIWLTAECEGREAVVVVRDNGMGIPSDSLERVFELFAQVDRSLSSASQWGLGIGLALVRKLVEMHGGSVRASSAGADQGSAFTVRLPLLGEAEEAPDAAPGEAVLRAAPAAGRKVRVLVVDDSRDAARSLALLLRMMGHDVETAHDGPAALQAARARPPEVVLLDIGLPQMDGYEVAARLRQEPETKGAYLVAMTGFGQEDARRRSLEVGFDCHLVKPVDPEAVQEILERRESPANSVVTAPPGG
jgi:signal transduction histidine kinase